MKKSLSSRIGVRPFDLLFVGICLFIFSYYLEFLYESKTFRAFVPLAWIMIILGYYKIPKNKVTDRIYAFLLFVYFSCVFIVLVRGYFFDEFHYWPNASKFIYDHFIQPYFVLPYILPIFALIDWKKIDFSFLSKFSIVICILFLFVFFSNHGKMIEFTEQLLIGEENKNWETPACSILPFFQGLVIFLLFPKYLSKTKYLVLISCCLVAIYVSIVGARRAAMVFLLFYLFLSLFLYSLEKHKLMYFFPIVGFVVVFFIYNIEDISFFEYLLERGMDDTRSAVDNAVTKDMTTLQLIFGQGLLGRYYYPVEGAIASGVWRFISETGYHNFVLRGGHFFAVVYILLLAYPAFLGFWGSNNKFTRLCAFNLGINILELYPNVTPIFDYKHFLMWMCIILCINKRVRNMNDDEVKLFIFKDKSIIKKSKL